VREYTRIEYQRLLERYAFRYFGPEVRLGDLDHDTLQGFVGWLIAQPGRRGRLTDRTIHNVVTPLRVMLKSAVAGGLLASDPSASLVLPKRRGGRAYYFQERPFLSRDELRRLLNEIPDEWRTFFVLLASTGLRISEAIGLRWEDLRLDDKRPRLWVRRGIVQGQVSPPKSRHGNRTIALSFDLANELRLLRPRTPNAEELVFPNRSGGPLNHNNLRNRVLLPSATRAGVPRTTFHTFRHTCAALLIARRTNVMRLQRWMGHHSAAFTMEAYGHLIDGELGTPLDLHEELLGRDYMRT
jgi:integrase